MMSHRSSASSFVADAIEEISMKPEPATNRMASDLLESRQAESNGPLFVTQASGASTLESVDAGLDRSQQGRADGGGISSRQEALTARSCGHSSSGASSTNMKCPKPEPAPRKQDACLQYVIVFQISAYYPQNRIRIIKAPNRPYIARLRRLPAAARASESVPQTIPIPIASLSGASWGRISSKTWYGTRLCPSVSM